MTYAIDALLLGCPGSIFAARTLDRPRFGRCLQEIKLRKMILTVATILTVVASASAFASGGGGGGGTDNPMPTAQPQASDE
jgi:hypothetical protein